MRKTETIELGDDQDKIEITIRELTVEQILGLFDKWKNLTGEEDDDQTTTMKKELQILFDLVVDGVNFESLNKYTPSELRELWDTFKGVNSVFFDVVNSLGIMESLKELINATKNDFLSIYRGSSDEDTGTS